MSACRKLNLLLIDSICLVGSYRPKNTTSFFHSVSKEMTHKPSKGQLQKIFPPECACYRYNLLWWIFFIPYGNWKSLFFIKVCCCFETLSATYCSFLWNKCFTLGSLSVFYIISTISLQVLIPKFQNWAFVDILYLINFRNFV